MRKAVFFLVVFLYDLAMRVNPSARNALLEVLTGTRLSLARPGQDEQDKSILKGGQTSNIDVDEF